MCSGMLDIPPLTQFCLMQFGSWHMYAGLNHVTAFLLFFDELGEHVVEVVGRLIKLRLEHLQAPERRNSHAVFVVVVFHYLLHVLQHHGPSRCLAQIL